MENLNETFEFDSLDLESNRQEQLTLTQRARLERAFSNDFGEVGKYVLQGVFIMSLASLTLYLIGSWAMLALSAIFWIMALISAWDEFFGQYNLVYMYRRVQDLRLSPKIQAIDNVSRDSFRFQDKTKHISIYTFHPLYANWFQSFKWFVAQNVRNYQGWYVLPHKNTQVMIAIPQYEALQPGVVYQFNCYIDSHDIAYVLSVEPQAQSR